LVLDTVSIRTQLLPLNLRVLLLQKVKRRDNHGDATMLAGFLGMITLALVALGTWGAVTIVSGVLLDAEEGKSDSRVDAACEEMFPASEPIGAFDMPVSPGEQSKRDKLHLK
jgi:hypothetical protein